MTNKTEIQSISPYKLTQLVSERAGREVRPQMVYAYVRKGSIPAFKNEAGKWQVTVEEAETFIAKYVEKNGVPATK